MTATLTPTARQLIELGTTPLTYADPYPGEADGKALDIECGKCGGRGRIPGYEHIENARCFDCDGSGLFRRTTVGDERRRERERTNRVNRDMLKVTKAEAAAKAKRAEFVAAHPGLAEALAQLVEGDDSFGCNLSAQLEARGTLTDSQVAAAFRSAERLAARTAEVEAAQPVTEGRQVITGEVVSTKWVDSQFGGAFKMLVKADQGFKVWGTHPEALFDNHLLCQPGQRVEFTATVEASHDDPKFGFFKRPAKARRV